MIHAFYAWKMTYLDIARAVFARFVSVCSPPPVRERSWLVYDVRCDDRTVDVL